MVNTYLACCILSFVEFGQCEELPIDGPFLPDPLRVRVPPVVPPMLPLQWGTVNPLGWIKDWAVTASQGAVSPKNSWFATGIGKQRTEAEQKALLVNGTDWPPGIGRANGWLKGQPAWTMDEQSAYWIDGMTRLGLVLDEPTLLARTKADISYVIENAQFTNHPHGTNPPEGWPRNVYSRAMLAYLDGTRDERVLPFFLSVWNSSYHLAAGCTQHDLITGCRSLTQTEAMLEGYSYGGSEELRDVAISGLEKHKVSGHFF